MLHLQKEDFVLSATTDGPPRKETVQNRIEQVPCRHINPVDIKILDQYGRRSEEGRDLI